MVISPSVQLQWFHIATAAVHSYMQPEDQLILLNSPFLSRWWVKCGSRLHTGGPLVSFLQAKPLKCQTVGTFEIP